MDSYEEPEEDAEHIKSPTPESKSPKPQLSEESIGKYFVIYYTEPLTYYWGKVTKVFSENEDGEVTRVEVDFLKKKTITSDPKDWSWVERAVKEIGIVPTDYIFYGSENLRVTMCTMYFPDETVYARLCEQL